MAYVPAYMGDLCRDVQLGASISTEAELPLAPVDRSEDLLKAAIELAAHPTAKGKSGVWDISVRIKTQGSLTRLISVNHPIDIKSNPKGSQVCVSLSDKVDKALVPCNDFVLLIRDSLVNKVSALTTGDTFPDHQFASIQILSDARPEDVIRRRTEVQADTGIVKADFEIDLNPNTLYQMSEAEKSKFEEESQKLR